MRLSGWWAAPRGGETDVAVVDLAQVVSCLSGSEEMPNPTAATQPMIQAVAKRSCKRHLGHRCDAERGYLSTESRNRSPLWSTE